MVRVLVDPITVPNPIKTLLLKLKNNSYPIGAKGTNHRNAVYFIQELIYHQKIKRVQINLDKYNVTFGFFLASAMLSYSYGWTAWYDIKTKMFYIGGEETGRIEAVSLFGLLTRLEKLGASYTNKNV